VDAGDGGSCINEALGCCFRAASSAKRVYRLISGCPVNDSRRAMCWTNDCKTKKDRLVYFVFQSEEKLPELQSGARVYQYISFQSASLEINSKGAI
jgi:hypothetical protein